MFILVLFHLETRKERGREKIAACEMRNVQSLKKKEKNLLKESKFHRKTSNSVQVHQTHRVQVFNNSFLSDHQTTELEWKNEQNYMFLRLKWLVLLSITTFIYFFKAKMAKFHCFQPLNVIFCSDINFIQSYRGWKELMKLHMWWQTAACVCFNFTTYIYICSKRQNKTIKNEINNKTTVCQWSQIVCDSAALIKTVHHQFILRFKL